MYPEIALPPVAGGVQETVSDAKLAFVDADGAPGVAGTVVTVTAADAADACDVPAALVAVTVNVGVAAEAIPVTIIGEDAPVAVGPVCDVPSPPEPVDPNTAVTV